MTRTRPIAPSGDDLLGLLDLLQRDEPVAAFEAWRTAALGGGADPATVARLHAAALALRSQLQDGLRREGVLGTLAATALELAADRDVEHLLRVIVERVRELLRSDLAYLTLLDEDRQHVYVRVVTGAQTESFSRIRLAVGAGLGGLVAASGTPFWTADMRTDARIVHTREVRSATAAEGLVAVCGVPLLHDGQVIGVLYVAERRPRSFTHHEIALMSSFAAHAAVALDNARLISETSAALAVAKSAVDALEAQAAALRRQDAVRRRLMELAVHGGRLVDVCDAVVETLGGSVAIFDEDGARLTGAGGTEPDAVRDVARRALDTRRAARDPSGDKLAVTALPMVARGDVLGVLAHHGPERPEHAAILESSAVVLCLMLLGRRSAGEAEQRVRGEFLEDLLRGRLDGDDARRRARLAGLRLDPPLTVAVIALRERDDPGRALGVARAAVTGRGGSAVLVDGLVVLVGPGSPGEVATSLHCALRARDIPAVVVADGAGAAGEELRAAHARAAQAAGALHALGRHDLAATPDEVGAFGALLAGGDPAAVDRFVEATLGPVLEYDRRRETTLVETLSVLYDSGGAHQVAADRLHVHVNTLHQRLDRISDLLGGSWREPWRGLNLHVAIVLHRMRDGRTR